MDPADWYADYDHLTWQGHTIPYRYEPRSGAPTILLIHGYPTASWDWYRIWPTLGKEFGLLAFDMLGFGWADKPRKHPYSMRNQADLAFDVLAHCDVADPHLLVHDYGVSVGQEMLARLAEGAPRLRSCCFLNGGLIPDQHRPTLIQKLLATPAGPLVARAISRRGFGRAFSQVFGPNTQPTAAELDICWSLIERNDGRPIIASLIAYMAERREFRDRWVGVLEAPPVPLRLVDGALDPVSGRHLAEEFARIVPNADVVILDDVGHYPQLEAPERVADAALAFFRSLA
ncbi:MAG: alpha/beta hydrolase [Pseudomonadota bacterium]